MINHNVLIDEIGLQSYFSVREISNIHVSLNFAADLEIIHTGAIPILIRAIGTRPTLKLLIQVIGLDKQTTITAKWKGNSWDWKDVADLTRASIEDKWFCIFHSKFESYRPAYPKKTLLDSSYKTCPVRLETRPSRGVMHRILLQLELLSSKRINKVENREGSWPERKGYIKADRAIKASASFLCLHNCTTDHPKTCSSRLFTLNTILGSLIFYILRPAIILWTCFAMKYMCIHGSFRELTGWAKDSSLTLQIPSIPASLAFKSMHIWLCQCIKSFSRVCYSFESVLDSLLINQARNSESHFASMKWKLWR